MSKRKTISKRPNGKTKAPAIPATLQATIDASDQALETLAENALRGLYCRHEEELNHEAQTAQADLSRCADEIAALVEGLDVAMPGSIISSPFDANRGALRVLGTLRSVTDASFRLAYLAGLYEGTMIALERETSREKYVTDGVKETGAMKAALEVIALRKHSAKQAAREAAE